MTPAPPAPGRPRRRGVQEVAHKKKERSSVMPSTTEVASFAVERMPIESATSEGLAPLGLPAEVTESWSRFAAPLVRNVFLVRDGAGIAGAAITAGRPLSSYLKIGGIWAADRVAARERPALRRALAEAAEAFAWGSGFAVVKRECAVGHDEDAASFAAAGYETVPAPEIGAPIPDPGPAVPAAQVKWCTRTDRTTVPYMRQTTDFTCGPAALSMLLAHYGLLDRVNRTTELELWREATTVLACDPYGLALAASGQRLTPRIVISTDEALFLNEGGTEQERELGRFIQGGFAGRAAEAGIEDRAARLRHRRTREGHQGRRSRDPAGRRGARARRRVPALDPGARDGRRRVHRPRPVD